MDWLIFIGTLVVHIHLLTYCLSFCLCFYCIEILYKHAAALFQLYACQPKMKLWGKEVPIKLVLQISPIKQTTHKFYCLA